MSSMKGLRWIWLAAIALVAACGGGSSTPARLLELGGQPCPGSDFSCITLDVPIDHSDPTRDRTIAVTFAVLPATGTTQGALVVAVGGPGASGVEEASWRFADIDPKIRRHFDLVFFDQRGVDMADELSCPDADEESGSSDPTSEELDTPWEERIAGEDGYLNSCLDEIGDPELLANLGTLQAAGDLEAFRRAVGYDNVIVYGESYGTQFAQTYASAYPGSVDRLVLDGTIDLTLDGIEATELDIETVDHVLDMIFDACDADADCHYDMAMPARNAYRQLQSELSQGPVTVRMPAGADNADEVELTDSDLGYLTFSTLYSEQDRMLFLRALAAYVDRDDLVPLLRLTGIGFGDGINSMVFNSIKCLETSIPGRTPAEEVEALSSARASVSLSDQWYFEDLAPCPYWPFTDHNLQPPVPFVARDIPTLVIASEGDPATPSAEGVSVYEHLDEGYLVTVQGGSHVMFGWGNECIDQTVTMFIIDGRAPATSTCDSEVITQYLPLLPAELVGRDTEELFWLADNELYFAPELMGWDRLDELTIGCSTGGNVVFSTSEIGVQFVLDACGLTNGLVISGDGGWDEQAGSSSYRDVRIVGQPCHYDYNEDWQDGSVDMDKVCT
jgi:pimeloyl-ACP methyl ester carboxylesterase